MKKKTKSNVEPISKSPEQDDEASELKVSRPGNCTPASRRTVRETLASHRSHQANVPVMPSFQCTNRPAFS